jgi:hypothetical protein
MSRPRWLARALSIGILAGAGTALVIGLSTDVIANRWFSRQIPVRPFDVAVLVALSVITGALAATHGLAESSGVADRRAGLGAGFLGWFAVSCPVCNKLVVALVGVSGATGVVEPLQPALGVLAVAVAAGALVVRVRAIRRGACRLPPVGSPTDPRPSASRPR